VDVSQLANDDFRRSSPRFLREAQARNRQLVDALATFAAARGLRSAQVALAWLLNKHPHVVPIPVPAASPIWRAM